MKAGSSKACIDFTNLVVDDNIALEGDEAFTIVIGSSVAMVTIIDDDGMYGLSLSDILSSQFKAKGDINSVLLYS